MDQLYPGAVKERVEEEGNSLRVEKLSAVEEGAKKGSWDRKRRLSKLGVRRKKFTREGLGGVTWIYASEISR